MTTGQLSVSPFGDFEFALVEDDENVSILKSLATTENVVRIGFSGPVYWSGLRDIGDASDPTLFSVLPNLGTAGLDGLAARSVTVVRVLRVDDSTLDLCLDRPLSPFPASYTMTASGLVDPTSKVGLPTLSETVLGCFALLDPPSIIEAIPSRDIANPQTYRAVQALGVPNVALALLGTYYVGEDGDYASDSGDVSLKKRIYRRLVTRKGSFAHAPNYGVGVPAEGKRLNSSTVRKRLADEAQRQIAQEPEVSKVVVTTLVDPNVPNLVRFIILVKTKSGQVDKYDIPFSSQTGLAA